MKIVREYARIGEVKRLPILSLEIPPYYPDVFFPELFKYIDVPSIEIQIYLLYARYIERGEIGLGDLDPYASHLLKRYDQLSKRLGPLQGEVGIAWMWADEYRESRIPASHLLYLFAYFRNPEAKAFLKDALSYSDPRLRFHGCIALLKWGEEIDRHFLYEIARSAEIRFLLYEKLDELGKLDLYPKEFKTQEALVESIMVMWLFRVSDIGQVPDEIELMKIFTINTEIEDGDLALYLYRFRMHPPHPAAEKGWMAGTSGPYLLKDGPNVEYLGGSGGRTWTDLEPWDSMSPEEHVGDLDKIKAEWLKYYYKYKKKE